jgi:hypothetical protein
MIVRIAAEGQYRMAGAGLDQLNEIDNKIVRAVEIGDERAFVEQLKAMLQYVRQNGQPLPLEELVESDLILPNEDISLDEAREIFSGEGLVPD